jgi:putative ABC transport system substrate-binding protein
MPVIGFLSTRIANESAHLVAAFRRGLAENGYVEGQNVAVEYRWALGQYDRLPVLATELVRRPVAVLASVGGDPAAQAAKAATATIPIVFEIGTDPIKLGLVTSYNRPGGNATGINILTSALEAKRLGLLRELVPQAAALGVLLNPNWPAAAGQLSDREEAARASVYRLMSCGPAPMARSTRPSYPLRSIVSPRSRWPAIRSLPRAATSLWPCRRVMRCPRMYPFRDYAVAGGLMSYGIDLPEVYRQVGVYAGRVLKGAKPADLPVMQPTKFEFVINLKTAKALGVKFSDNLMSLADEVIE